MRRKPRLTLGGLECLEGLEGLERVSVELRTPPFDRLGNRAAFGSSSEAGLDTAFSSLDVAFDAAAGKTPGGGEAVVFGGAAPTLQVRSESESFFEPLCAAGSKTFFDFGVFSLIVDDSFGSSGTSSFRCFGCVGAGRMCSASDDGDSFLFVTLSCSPAAAPTLGFFAASPEEEILGFMSLVSLGKAIFFGGGGKSGEEEEGSAEAGKSPLLKRVERAGEEEGKPVRSTPRRARRTRGSEGMAVVKVSIWASSALAARLMSEVKRMMRGMGSPSSDASCSA
jgi:hypothetical protein